MEGPPGAEVPVQKPAEAANPNADQQQPAYDYSAQWAAYYAMAAARAQAAQVQQHPGGAPGAPMGGYPGFPGYPPYNAAAATGAYPGYPAYNPTPVDPSAPQPSHTIWVGGLPNSVTEADLRQVFCVFGNVENVKMLPEKNCAFLRYTTIREAMEAHSQMTGQYIGGQQIKMGWGKPDELGRDDGPSPCKNLWIGNIGPNTTEYDIEKLFSSLGVIERIRVLPAKNCAFVTFSTLESALEARRKMQGALLDGKPIKINFGKSGDASDGDGVQVLNPDYLTLGPPQPSAPIDPKQRAIIDKLALYTMKNGPQMEDVTRQKQINNPLFEFLTEGGKYHEYYKWKIYDCRRLSNENQSNPIQAAVQATASLIAMQLQRGPPTAPPATGPILTEAEGGALSNHLDTLVPTKDSIKKGKDFIMSLPHKASAVAAFVCLRLQQTPDWTAKLNIIYLTNDVLHHSAKKRELHVKRDALCDAFQPFLGPMLYNAYFEQPEDRQQQIKKLLSIWKTKEIFPADEIDRITERVEYIPSTYGTQANNDNNDNGGIDSGYVGSPTNPNLGNSSSPTQQLGGLHAVPPPQQAPGAERLINNLDEFLKSRRLQQQQQQQGNRGGGGGGGARGDDDERRSSHRDSRDSHSSSSRRGEHRDRDYHRGERDREHDRDNANFRDYERGGAREHGHRGREEYYEGGGGRERDDGSSRKRHRSRSSSGDRSGKRRY